MKSVLMIAYHFPPDSSSGTYRTLKFARYLPDHGYRPIILTVLQKHLDSYSPLDPELLAEVPKEVEIIRTPVFDPFARLLEVRNGLRWVLSEVHQNTNGQENISSYVPESRNGIIRQMIHLLESLTMIPDNKVGWLPYAFLAGMRTISKHDVDVIYSSGPPFTCHLIGLALSKASRKPWIADFRDPWTEGIDFEHRHPTRIERAIEKSMEYHVVKNAHKIACVSEPMDVDFKKRYECIDSKKGLVITNGFDPNDFENLKRTKTRIFTISHVGSLYGSRTPEYLLEALRGLVRDAAELSRKIRVLFVGHVAEEHMAAINSFPIPQMIEVIPWVSRRESLEYMVSSDLLLLIVHDSSEGKNKHMLTGKIFEYIGAGKPILALAPKDGAIARLIDEIGVGKVVPIDDIMQIRSAIGEFFHKYQQSKLDVYAGNTLRKQRYNRQKQTEELAKTMDMLVRNQRTQEF